MITNETAELLSFVTAAQDKINLACKSDVLPSPALSVEVNKKYVRIVRTNRRADSSLDDFSRSVFCFIDRATGSILKAESWSRPAKGVRGNINTPDFGASAVTPYGAVYFR